MQRSAPSQKTWLLQSWSTTHWTGGVVVVLQVRLPSLQTGYIPAGAEQGALPLVHFAFTQRSTPLQKVPSSQSVSLLQPQRSVASSHGLAPHGVKKPFMQRLATHISAPLQYRPSLHWAFDEQVLQRLVASLQAATVSQGQGSRGGADPVQAPLDAVAVDAVGAIRVVAAGPGTFAAAALDADLAGRAGHRLSRAAEPIGADLLAVAGAPVGAVLVGGYFTE
jgi:hypothetical protein